MFYRLISPKALKRSGLGRSSDLSFFECLPAPIRAVACRVFKGLGRIYSSGSVQESHLIPFSSHPPIESGEAWNRNRGKDKKTSEKRSDPDEKTCVRRYAKACTKSTVSAGRQEEGSSTASFSIAGKASLTQCRSATYEVSS